MVTLTVVRMRKLIGQKNGWGFWGYPHERNLEGCKDVRKLDYEKDD